MIVSTNTRGMPVHPMGPQSMARTRGRQRGLSIIETIVLMTAVAAMLGLCVMMLQLLFRLDSDSRARLDGATAVARLARQFREDLHRAKAAHMVDQPASKTVALRIEPGPDRTIEYQVKGDGKILRLESSKDKLVRRESYLIPRTLAIQLALKKDNGREFATLTVSRLATKNRTDPARPLEVVALLGKNRDLVAAAARAKGEKP